MRRSRRIEPDQVATPAEFMAIVFAYLDLLGARWSALAARLDPLQRPVPVAGLRVRGIHDGILLWMLHQAQVVHLHRPAPQRRRRPSPRPAAGILPTPASAFALTPDGEHFVGDFLLDVIYSPGLAPFRAAWDRLLLAPLLPHYDRDRRTLRWGRHILKQYRQLSPNQEIVLAAANELRWPAWFDDPLPHRVGINPKARLHDTIKSLNHHQQNHFIHFKGDGTGTRIGWEFH